MHINKNHKLSIADVTNRDRPREMSFLFKHSFLIPLLIDYLDDASVLTRLLLANKEARKDLTGYRVMQYVTPSILSTIANSNRYLPVRISCVKGLVTLPIIPTACVDVLTKISFGSSRKTDITAGSIPDTVTHLTFADSFNGILPAGSIPQSVTYLKSGWTYTPPGVIPPSVTHLTLLSFDQSFAGVIPTSVTHLVFHRSGRESYARLFVGDIPDSVTNMTYSWPRDHPYAAGVIPASVTYLDLKVESNQPLPVGMIPESVSNCALEYDGYHRKGDDFRTHFPPCVTHLTFGAGFGQPFILAGVVSNSVTHLTLGKLWNLPIMSGMIPASVTHLEFGLSFDQYLETGDIPHGVTHVTFGDEFNRSIFPGDIPASVTHLSFGLRFVQDLYPDVVPDGVTHLTISRPSILDHSVLPASTTHLRFARGEDKPISAGVIPTTITHLTLDWSVISYLIEADVIPSAVSHLILGKALRQPEQVFIPSTVCHLTCGKGFRALLPNSVVNSLRWLELIDDFPQT